MARHLRRSRRGRSSRKIFTWAKMRWVLLAGVIFSALFSGYVFYLDYTIRTQFEGKRWAIPAKVFARPLELYPGAQLSADQFENELLVLSYNKS
ncbi:hypothetical protein, partial [Kaarinaea lacus]